MTDCIDILFLGDIVGRPGRQILAKYLEGIKSGDIPYANNGTQPDFIIANVENASHGFGLTERNYNELSNLGINVMTSGNHIWDKKELFGFIDKAEKLVRPINYPKGTPGKGSIIYDLNGIKIGVINLLGRVFMTPIDSPWNILEDEVKKIQYETPIIIIDFHAEATAEKVSMGYFADKLGVSAVVGTHTHIQTADEKILDNGTAYITDVGLCGAIDSVIGMDKETSLKRLITSLPERFDIAPSNEAELNGVRLVINTKTGCAQSIERIRFFTNLGEVK